MDDDGGFPKRLVRSDLCLLAQAQGVAARPSPLQTRKQPRIPTLGLVIANRNPQSLLLPNEYQQPLAPRDPGVNQVTLQKHEVLHSERDHHGGKLRALRFMDADSVGEGVVRGIWKVVATTIENLFSRGR
jgi:hypothetical protein